MRGCRMSVAAMATRCCMPPESSEGYFFSEPSRPTFFTHSCARSSRSERAHAAQLQAEGDVVEHIQVRQERVFLVHQAAVGPRLL